VTSTPHPAGGPWPGGCPVPAAACNSRDLGGARTVDGTQVRRGLVYRCGALDGLTCAGWDAVADLGVRTVFDLRAAHERIGRATGAVRVGVDVVQIPMGENGEPGTTLSDRVFSATGRTPEQSVAAYATAKVAAYVAMVTAYAPGFGAVIEGLSAPGTLPAVMHCAAGKDRTGLAAAIVLRMLGSARPGCSRTMCAPERVSPRPVWTGIDTGWNYRAFPSSSSPRAMPPTPRRCSPLLPP